MAGCARSICLAAAFEDAELGSVAEAGAGVKGRAGTRLRWPSVLRSHRALPHLGMTSILAAAVNHIIVS